MDYKDIGLIILTGGLSAIGWFAKTVWSDHNSTKEKLNNFQVYVGDHYVKYDRLKDIMQPIMEALQEIKDTLKTKADK